MARTGQPPSCEPLQPSRRWPAAKRDRSLAEARGTGPHVASSLLALSKLPCRHCDPHARKARNGHRTPQRTPRHVHAARCSLFANRAASGGRANPERPRRPTQRRLGRLGAEGHLRHRVVDLRMRRRCSAALRGEGRQTGWRRRGNGSPDRVVPRSRHGRKPAVHPEDLRRRLRGFTCVATEPRAADPTTASRR